MPIFKSLVWLDPEKIPSQAGFEPGTFRSRGGRLNHLANEAVCREDSGCSQVSKGCCSWVGQGIPPTKGWGNHGPHQGVSDPCGVYDGPNWVPGAVTVVAARGWVVTEAVVAEEGWAVTVRGGTTISALDTSRDATVVSLALLSGEVGYVAVALTLCRPPNPAMGDVSGSLPEPPNPAMGEACGGCGIGPSLKVAVVSLVSVSREAGRVVVALDFREPPDLALGDISSGLPEPPDPAMGEALRWLWQWPFAKRRGEGRPSP